MADEHTFIPTHIANFQGEVLGDILWDFTCKALVSGQCLMTVGGYVVRGLTLACGKRAKAVRRADGAFERVNPNCCSITMGEAPQQPLALPAPQQPLALPPPQPTVPIDDLAGAASSICLAIQENAPSSASELQGRNLMPELDKHKVAEASELHVQEMIQFHESKIQQQMAQQQFDQDIAAAIVASIHDGKRPLPPS